MRRLKKSARRFLIISCIVWLCAILASTAWATFSFIKAQDVSTDMKTHQNSPPKINILSHQGKTRSRAPEPTTMALFGSGLLGMIVNFVRKAYDRVKRTFDIVASIMALIISFPLCLLIAVLIKLTSRGPVFFKQARVGKDGHVFEMYKFRTMRVDAEKETGPVWATQDDHRLIPIGPFIRKSHIDEFPQFINVLKGEMSIIGPRPERPFFVAKLVQEIPDYTKRLSVKPGITGLAQVWHKYDETIEDVKKKVKYDLLYIRKVCLWTDLMIMLRTIRVVFTGEGAR